MELLKQIRTEEIANEAGINLREAVRIIWIDENNLVPLLFVSNHNYHKLPGWGIDEWEDIVTALKRECMEEIGAEIEIIWEVGEIHEYHEKFNKKQISYCYFGKILTKGNPNFTEHELAGGFQIVWLNLEKAIEKIKNDKPDNYEGAFIQERDLCFLETYKKIAHD